MRPLQAIIPDNAEKPPFETVPYYIAQQNGWFVNSPGLFGIAQTKSADPPPILQSLEPRFHLNGKKLPKYCLTQAHDFFRRIFEKHKTEASVYIVYNDAEDRFALFAPVQYVNAAGVYHKLDADSIPKGFRAVGTIHSHCDFSAFHSGTDTHDMEHLPGLHLTMGHVNRDEPEIVYALSVGKTRFDTTREDVIDETAETDKNGYATAPPFWDNFVTPGTAPWATHARPVHVHNSKSVHGMTPTYGYGGWDDDDWAGIPGYMHAKQDKHRPKTKWEQEQEKKKEVFEEYADLVATVEAYGQELREYMALFGLIFQFSIYFNQKQADKILEDAETKLDAEVDEALEQMPLLPEEAINAGNAAA